LKQSILGNRKKYYREFTALNKISFQIKKGSTVGIVGRNGSGKSTLLQIIAGILTPTTGKVKVNGRIAALLELGAGFNPEFTGRENVYLNASILGIEEEVIKRRFDEIVEFSEIGNFIDQPVKTYSSGMFVRLAFSVATLTNPEIVIIDEALSVGDEKFQRKCYNHLENLKNKGCTILFVSHSMRTVEQICDYAYLLDYGKLLGEGEPKKIIDQYHLLLYSQENDILKNLNHSIHIPEQNEEIEEENENNEEGKITRIEHVGMYNINGEESYVFYSGARSRIVLKIVSDIPQDDVQVGLRIKTTHGVEVYGTSSAYYNMGLRLEAKKPVYISFEQNLRLVAGTYHVSVAIAKKIGANDMIYFDKLSDFLLFKVEEIPLTGTGIANLDSRIDVLEG
jgi:ABC-type polysaccharide/polyol phosphate transport system ATPase subunit